MGMSIGSLFVELKVKSDRSLKSAPGKLKKTGTAATGLGASVGRMGAMFKAALGPITLVVAALAGVTAAASKAIAAADVQVQSVNRLNVALANQGNLLPGTSSRLQEYANQMQQTTRFGDEQILSASALAASFGANEEQIKSITSAAADMATGMGIDLKAAVNLVGKAFVGETGSLSKYGIIVDKSIPKNEKFAAVMEQLQGRFGGVAESATGTLGGAFSQLGNAMGDILESAGILIQTFFDMGGGGTGGIQWLTEQVGNFAKWLRVDLVLAVSEANAQIAEFIASGVEGMANFQSKVAGVVGIFNVEMGDAIGNNVLAMRAFAEEQRLAAEAIRLNGDQIALQGTNMQIVNNDLARNTEGVKTNTAASVLATNTLKTWNQLQATWRTENALMLDQQLLWSEGMTETFAQAGMDAQAWGTVVGGIGDLNAKETTRITAAWNRMGLRTRAQSQATEAQLVADLDTIKATAEGNIAAIEAAEQRLADFRAQQSGQNVANSGQMWGDLQGLANTGLAALGKDNKKWAIAQAVMNTAVAVTKALTALPFPANLPAAAGAAAAGAVQIATISSQSGFRRGTPGLDFQDFGTETGALLHGNEAVIPQGGGHQLAGEIAASLMPVMANGGGRGAPAPASSGQAIGPQTPLNLTIQVSDKDLVSVLIPALEDATKRGTLRVHETALGSRSKF